MRLLVLPPQDSTRPAWRGGGMWGWLGEESVTGNAQHRNRGCTLRDMSRQSGKGMTMTQPPHKNAGDPRGALGHPRHMYRVQPQNMSGSMLRR
jgi:hypothetical protein